MADLFVQPREHYPEIVVDVSFEDRLVDLVEEGYDVALRVTGSQQSLPAGLVARPARALPRYVAASREYLTRFGGPKSPEDLAHHDCVAVGDMASWIIKATPGKIEVPARIVLRYRSLGGVANAVAAGAGLAPLPDIFFVDPVFKDVLMPVLLDYPLESPTVYVVYVSRKYLPLKIRTFVDFFLQALERMPPTKPPAAG
jgi:DNA-binding transcriptional LysR family regulator